MNNIIYNILDLAIYLAIIATPIVLIAKGVKAIKRAAQKNYELRKYQAETERIKAEAMRDQASDRKE